MFLVCSNLYVAQFSFGQTESDLIKASDDQRREAISIKVLSLSRNSWCDVIYNRITIPRSRRRPELFSRKWCRQGQQRRSCWSSWLDKTRPTPNKIRVFIFFCRRRPVEWGRVTTRLRPRRPWRWTHLGSLKASLNKGRRSRHVTFLLQYLVVLEGFDQHY